MKWQHIWRRLSGEQNARSWKGYRDELEAVNRRRRDLLVVGDEELKEQAGGARHSRVEAFARACEAARRTLGVEPFDEQVIGGLVMADGHLAEMQTGEGKTLAATLPAAAAALRGEPVHLLTANDYLARRDAEWMGPIYRSLGLSVGWVEQGLDLEARKTAYACDITYGSATEVGFDYLRDQLRRRPGDLVQQPFGLAIVDEADSALIDEARIPLVIAGGHDAPADIVRQADEVVRQLEVGIHYEPVEGGRRVVLTEEGAARTEDLLGCANLFDSEHAPMLAAVSQAIHAHALLARDVDYVVKDGRVELIDENKGRLAQGRRWPEGLQAAVEAREGVELRHAGRILGSITVQSFVGLYPTLCGMTGTAERQAAELRELYDLDVVRVPTHRPVIRRDLPDLVLPSREEKEHRIVAEIQAAHALGRPVLVGTASVADSEGLGRRLATAGIPHQILNARHEAAEAAIVRQAGRPGAVTVSTNMAGRGTDILLGGDPPEERERVMERGGLLVIGTTRHESRRIDDQLRGRAGRQGDPGESRFILSLHDELLARYGLEAQTDLDHAQRVIEGQHLEVRLTLHKYERLVEQQRRIVHARRREVLVGEAESLVQRDLPNRHQALSRELGEDEVRRLERAVTLTAIDQAWSVYLEEVALVKEDVAWVSLSRVPLHEYQHTLDRMFRELWTRIESEVIEAFAEGTPAAPGPGGSGTGSTWTYQTSDEAFPDAMGRLTASLRRLLRAR
jgi:preprotein translocase subunit SecA